MASTYEVRRLKRVLGYCLTPLRIMEDGCQDFTARERREWARAAVCAIRRALEPHRVRRRHACPSCPRIPTARMNRIVRTAMEKGAREALKGGWHARS